MVTQERGAAEVIGFGIHGPVCVRIPVRMPGACVLPHSVEG